LDTIKFKALLGIFGIQDIEAIKLMRCRIFGEKVNGIWYICNRYPKISSGIAVTFCSWN